MIHNFEQFITETLQKSQSIIKSKMQDYEKLKDFLTSENSIGYLGKLTEFLFSGVPYNELVNLYNEIIDFKKKNIKFNLDSYDTYENALDEIARKKIAYKFRYIYNQFPKEQKDLLNIDTISDSGILTISKLYDVDDYTPLIKKISRYKRYSDLIDAVEFFLKSKSKSYSREYIKSLLDENIQLVFENENILIIKVKNCESIKKVGDDTSWCIVSSQAQFNSYTKEGRNQYVLFDYTKDQFEVDFKIAFTVSQEDKVLYAHNIIDSSCVSYLIQILVDNNVDLNIVNLKDKIDTSKFNNQSTLNEISEAIEYYHLTEEDINKLLTILCFKENRSKNGQLSKRLIVKMFKKIKNRKGNILEESDFDKYKTCFRKDAQFQRIKDELINLFVIISDAPPDSLFNKNKYHRKSDIIDHYKRWNITINDENFEHFLLLLRKDTDYLEMVKYYIGKTTKLTNKVKLLREYCKFLSGEQINEDSVKKLIDTIIIRDKYRYEYYNYFGFKYHFNEDEYTEMKPDNIIPEKITIIADWQLESKLKILKNCDVTVNISKDYLLDKINKDYKVVGGKICQRATSIDKNYSGIFYVIVDKLTFEGKIRKKIIFKPDTEFPIEFKYMFRGKFSTYTKESKVVIS